MIKEKKMLATLGAFLIALIWGYSFVAIKDIVEYIPSLYLIAGRKLLGATLLFIILFRKMKNITSREFLRSFVIGIVLFFAMILQTSSLKHINASKVAFYIGSNVIFVPFFACVFIKKIPHITAFIAAFVGFMGLAFLTFQDFTAIEMWDFVAITSAMMGGLYTVLVGRAVVKMSGSKLTVISLFTTGVLSVIFGVLTSPFPNITVLPNKVIISFLYLAIFCTAIAFLLQNICQKYISPSNTSLILASESFFGAACGVIFLHEPLKINLIVAGVLIFVAIIICEIGENITEYIAKIRIKNK